jgi:hypothetical protein
MYSFSAFAYDCATVVCILAEHLLKLSVLYLYAYSKLSTAERFLEFYFGESY